MESVISFVSEFIDRAIRCTKNALMSVVYSEYSPLVRLDMNGKNFNGLKAAEIASIRDKVTELKRLVSETVQDHCGIGLFTLKLHLPYHLTGNPRRFGIMEMLDPSPFERYDVHVKRVYRHTSQRRFSSMAEMVRLINQNKNNSATASKFQATIEIDQKWYAQEKLKEERNIKRKDGEERL